MAHIDWYDSACIDCTSVAVNDDDTALTPERAEHVRASLKGMDLTLDSFDHAPHSIIDCTICGERNTFMGADFAVWED